MNLETFIAKRYIISKHKINFITIISFISIVGVTIGVAALIVVLSVFNGFGSLVTKYMMNFEPHIRALIISEAGEKNIHQLSDLLSESKETEGFTYSRIKACKSKHSKLARVLQYLCNVSIQ